MSTPIPSGSEGLIPHLVVDGCAQAIDFYKAAFGAIEVTRVPTPDGSRLMHAEIRIEGRPLYLCDDFPEQRDGQAKHPAALGATTVTIHQFVEDCDAAIAIAEEAGATVTMPAQDTFWGDRFGKIADPYGHEWSFATHLRDVTPEEMHAAIEAMG